MTGPAVQRAASLAFSVRSQRYRYSLHSFSTASGQTHSPTLWHLIAEAQGSSDQNVAEATQSITASIRSLRNHSSVSFLSLYDGSLPGDSVLQAVVRKSEKAALEATGKLSPGAAVNLTGRFQRSKGQMQQLEFLVEYGAVIAECDTASHPLLSSSKVPRASLLRQHAHLRSQLPVFAATMRLRCRLENAMAEWFDQQEFIRTQPPIITSTDCEGAGEVFRVSDTKDSEEHAAQAYLTVSAQLHLEALLLGLGRVYSFIPTFRAEESATNRHLREFWMCEAELPVEAAESEDQQLEEIMHVVEQLIRHAARTALGMMGTGPRQEAAFRDVEFLHSSQEPMQGSLQELYKYFGHAEPSWQRISYSRAIEILQERYDEGHWDEGQTARPQWGDSISSEQEKYLCTERFSSPLFVTDYPAALKPFYMRVASEPLIQNFQGKTVKCFDLLVPGIGELVGGSLREDRAEVLQRRMAELRLNKSTKMEKIDIGPGVKSHALQWYTSSLRRSGMPCHGGFGVGVERLVMWIAKQDSVRDCIPFPRVGRHIKF